MRKGTRRPRNYASQCAGHWLVANSNQSRRSKRDHQASHGKTSMSINDLWNFDVLGVVKQGWKKGWFTSIGTVSIPFPTYNNCYVTFGALVGIHFLLQFGK